MKKRLMAHLLTLSMLLALLPATARAASITSFSDVSAKDWFYEDVAFAASKGYFVGTGGSAFEPELTMTRAMFVTVLSRLDGAQVDNSTSVFTDVPANTWYTGAVTWAAANGIVEGIGNHLFAPDASITREEMCVIMARFVNYYGKKTNQTHKKAAAVTAFTDASDISAFAVDAVAACQSYGLINGYPDGRFAPKDYSTRAQAAAVIHRLDWVVNSTGSGGSGSGSSSGGSSGGGSGSGSGSVVSSVYDREVVSLNGAWSFTLDDATETVTVPHSWEYTNMSAYSPAGSIKTGVYEKTVDISAYRRDGRALFLRFDGVNKLAVVFVDGVEVGRHNGGFTAFAIDITEACAGKDSVTVRVETTNITMDTMPVNTDFTHFAGIYRDVALVAVNRSGYLALEDDGSQGVYLASSVDLSNGSAVITPTVMLSYQDVPAKQDITLTVEVKDASGHVVGHTAKTVSVSGSEIAAAFAPGAIELKDAHL